MQSLINATNKALSSEQVEKILKRKHPVILCKLYQPNNWIWSRLNNEIFSECVFKNLFDDDINTINISHTLEIVNGCEKEIGYFFASDLAKLLLYALELKKREEIDLNDKELQTHIYNICSMIKNYSGSMPDYKQLLTEEIVNALPPLGNRADIHFKQKNVICKFHIPGEYAWYVFEGEFDPEKGYRFLGLMEKNGTELKHFYLTEILKLIEMGFPLQLDTSLFNVPYCEVQSQ